MSDVSNRDDVIDSRDVIARIEELEAERQPLADAVEGANDGAPLAQAVEALEEWDARSEGDELKALKALADECEQYASDWQHGETLIRDSYFETYAEELARDIGAIKDGADWPLCHIDWEAAAEALQQDYSQADFDGVTYWIRAS